MKKPKKTCPDCHAQVGKKHEPGCSVEPCPDCGRTAVACGHYTPQSEAMPWTGSWPGAAECRKFGFVQKGVISEDGGDHPLLNKLYRLARWDQTKKKWVLP